jgi:hypothetical protein
MGWPVPNVRIRQSGDFEWFKAAATQKYGGDTSWYTVWTFVEQAQIGDLVLFRNTDGRFCLAELLGPWRYEYQNADAIGADIVNFRKMAVVEDGAADAMPAKITACTRPSRTFQAIRSPEMLAFSTQLASLSRSRSADWIFMSS